MKSNRAVPEQSDAQCVGNIFDSTAFRRSIWGPIHVVSPVGVPQFGVEQSRRSSPLSQDHESTSSVQNVYSALLYQTLPVEPTSIIRVHGESDLQHYVEDSCLFAKVMRDEPRRVCYDTMLRGRCVPPYRNLLYYSRVLE